MQLKSILRTLIRYHAGLMVFGTFLILATNVVSVQYRQSALDETMGWLYWGVFVPGLVIGCTGSALWPVDSFLKRRNKRKAR